jgi:DNA polymerase III delta prime subunit
MKRMKHILDKEKVEYGDKVLAALIQKHFPDYRRIIMELQRYSVSGKIDEGILAQVGEIKINDLVPALKKKDFDKVRKWVVNNLDNDSTRIFRQLYDALYDHIEESTIPLAIIKLADYQYKAAFVADQEINLVSCLIELMVDCEFK